MKSPGKAQEGLAQQIQLYSAGMTTRVGSKGQIVIPKEIRDRVSLHSGDEVDVELQGTTIIVTARQRPQGLGDSRGAAWAARLLEDRAAEPR